MVSIVTNYGRAAGYSALLMDKLPTGDAIGAELFLIPINDSYTWATPNPDHDDVGAELSTWAIDPAGLVTNSNRIQRGDAYWAVTIDDTNDEGFIIPVNAPVLTAGPSAISNIDGFALALQNNVLAGNRVLSLLHFSDGPFSIGANQSLTLNGLKLRAA